MAVVFLSDNCCFNSKSMVSRELIFASNCSYFLSPDHAGLLSNVADMAATKTFLFNFMRILQNLIDAML